MTQQDNTDAFDPFAMQSSGSPSGKVVDVFDPFGLGDNGISLGDDVSSTGSPNPPPEVTRFSRTPKSTTPTKSREESDSKGPKKPSALSLPPKLVIKFTVHEEVSSVAKRGEDNQGSSAISVEGTVGAQVQSSDARKNSPFALTSSSSQDAHLVFRGNDEYVVPSRPSSPRARVQNFVTIPKSDIAGVTIGNYTLTEDIQHMPILVERKTTFYDKTCRVMVQVRSKLNNLGDMTDFTIAIAVPEKVNGDTVEVTRGKGTWDGLKRAIKWELPLLPRGESVMVCAQAELWAPVTDGTDKPVFPVLVRCSSSNDHISSAQFKASDADGHPATIAYSRRSSFRLLHRLL